jgi:hypothetical protein
MLMFLLGLPNQFTQWCEALIVSLAERASGSLLCSTAGSSEGLLQAMIERSSQHILVSQQQPGSWLHRTLAAANGRCVVALADPRACVAQLATGPGSTLIDVVSGVANSCATLTSYLSLPGALVLRAEEHAFDAVATARRIADHLQLPSADEDIFKALDTALPLDPTAVATVAWGDRFDASELVLINGALAGYADYFTGGPLGNLVWAPGLFFVGDTHQRVTGPIDITGRSRCLIFGPYIRLPAGRWNADVAVAFADLGGSKDFIIDVATPVQLNAISINVINQGGVQTSLPFVLDPANESAVEVRVSINSAAFEGRLALGAVTLRPQQDSPKELLELLNTASNA